jgi:hypothetical protein
MTPEIVAALGSLFVAMMGAFGALFLKIWTAFERQDRFRDAQIGLLWRMVDLRDRKLEEVARSAGVSVNGEYEAEKRGQRQEWDDMIRRGSA